MCIPDGMGCLLFFDTNVDILRTSATKFDILILWPGGNTNGLVARTALL